MPPAFTGSQTSIELIGTAIPGAEDRQHLIPGFDQQRLARASALCIGAGGLTSYIAPPLVRKGIGRITVCDDDLVETSNLNRQRFYIKDVGRNKAIALAENLQGECIAETRIRGIPFRFQEAVARGLDLGCDVAICGVDNNPARVAVSRHFLGLGIPVVFTAVSRDANNGYVFVQERAGPCIACLFPDIANDERYPCPGTPAISDILQAVGALSVYAVDTLLMARPRSWNYRTVTLSDGGLDSSALMPVRVGCPLCRNSNGKET